MVGIPAIHVVELKRWLKCRGATTAGRKEDLVKRLAQCMYFIKDIEPNYNFLIYHHSFPLIIVNFISLCVFRVHDYISLGLDRKRKVKRMLLYQALFLQ